jgi:hypothetical protein
MKENHVHNQFSLSNIVILCFSLKMTAYKVIYLSFRHRGTLVSRSGISQSADNPENP